MKKVNRRYCGGNKIMYAIRMPITLKTTLQNIARLKQLPLATVITTVLDEYAQSEETLKRSSKSG